MDTSTKESPWITAELLCLDLDGTLVDTESIFADSWSYAARTIGIGAPRNTVQEVREQRLDSRGTIATLFGDIPGSTARAVIEAAHEYRTAARERLPLLSGVRRFLIEARDRGQRLVLVTNAPAWRMNETLDGIERYEAFDIRTVLSLTVCPVGSERLKPHGDLYARAVRQSQVKPAAAFAFEDSRDGLRSATSAGLSVAHVSTSHGRDCAYYGASCRDSFLSFCSTGTGLR